MHAEAMARTEVERSEVESLKTIVVEPGTKLEEIERLAILATLRFRGNNRTHAAKTLGIGIRTLQRKLKQYGIESIAHAV